MEHITVEEFKKLNKGRGRRIKQSIPERRTYRGIIFASIPEMQYYRDELFLRDRAGEITDLRFQPAFELQPVFRKNGKLYHAIKYIADFSFFDVKENRKRIIDVKGMKTEKFLLKQKMFEYKFLDLILELV